MSKFLDDWLDGMKQHNPNRGKSAITIKNDKWDIQDFEDIQASMKPFRDEREALCDTVETGRGATADTFLSFYKDKPKHEDPENVRPDHVVNAFVRDELEKMREWEELRSLGTVGDDLSSAFAFIAMRPDLNALFDKVKHEQDLAKQMAEKARELQEMQADAKSPDDLMEEMERLQQEIADLADQIQDGLAGKQGLVAQGLRDGMKEAKDEIQTQESAQIAYGREPGSLQRLDGQKRLELAKRIKDKPKLKEIADKVGPMLALMHGERRKKVAEAREEVYDVELGDDFGRLLPSELMNIRHPLLKRWFWKNYVDQHLLQYKMKGEDKVGLGGIVCAIDCSVSMAGDREIWAKAVGISLLHLARLQKRSYHGILFASSSEIAEFDFSKDELFSSERVMDFAEHFFAGGTDFMIPLTVAVKRLREEFDASGQVKGDIVFITDGACEVDDVWLRDFNKERETMGFQVFGVLVGSWGYGGTETLDLICDSVTTVENLATGDDVRGVFRDIHEPN